MARSVATSHSCNPTSLPFQLDPIVNGKSLDQIAASALVGNRELGPAIVQILKNCQP
jgi:hypothetical protein